MREGTARTRAPFARGAVRSCAGIAADARVRESRRARWGEGGVAREGWYAGTLRAGVARVDGAGEGRRTRGGEGNARA